jgi:hypothetical protein
MTFTYLGTLTTNLDKVRFYIQDTVANDGPKPDDLNFTDEELTGLISVEGSWQRAVAGAFEALAAAWTRYADIQIGTIRESMLAVAESYLRQAKRWREQYGGSASGIGTRHPTRVDGYSSDVASNEV